ncbi:MAG: phosphatidylglycerol lysyltransferase domain-containing protein, partial [Clostridiaceae bacterium]
MLEFKNLEINDREIFDEYLNPYKFKTCEYSFTNLIIWKKSLDIKYAVYKDALIIKKKDFEGKYHFMQPIGYAMDDLADIVSLLKAEKDDSFNYLFRFAEEDFTFKLKGLDPDLIIEEDRDNFDYIY